MKRMQNTQNHPHIDISLDIGNVNKNSSFLANRPLQ